MGFSRRDGRHYAEKLPEPLSSKELWVKLLRPKAFELLVAQELPEASTGALAAHAGERIPIKSQQLNSLFHAFQKVKDPRGPKARQFPLGAVLCVIALAPLRGQVHLSAIVRQS